MPTILVISAIVVYLVGVFCVYGWLVEHAGDTPSEASAIATCWPIVLASLLIVIPAVALSYPVSWLGRVSRRVFRKRKRGTS